jgi:(p)ppGpp synthase/HD superfamily hydrolase
LHQSPEIEYREKLRTWVKLKYRGRLIRRTKEPYFNHLCSVAELAGSAVPFGYEIGLCHDLLEDTNTTPKGLRKNLKECGFDRAATELITHCVIELTDVFTKEAYPKLRKSVRKSEEARRLTMISPASQTVKYADLIDNILWVLKYDPKKALPYLKRKKALLCVMDKGNGHLLQQAMVLATESIKILIPVSTEPDHC